MSRSLCFNLILVLSLPCVSRGEDIKDDAKSMEGTWRPSAAELRGEKYPDGIRKAMKLVIKEGKYTVTVGAATENSHVKLDPSKRPKTMDITGAEGPNQGKPTLAIYELSGDSLRICYDLSGNTRPTEFKTLKGSELFLVSYDREKP